MRNLTKPALLSLAGGAVAAAMISAVAIASDDGSKAKIENADQITAMLAAEGYQVTEMEREDGLIEVEALRDGQEYEIYVDPADNRIVKTELGD